MTSYYDSYNSPRQQSRRITKSIKLDTTPRPRILVLDSYGSPEACVAASGGIPINASPRSVESVVRALESYMVDGMLLVGGGDIDPRRYGSRPHKSVYGVSEMRDELELLALDFAKENGLPVMGICRGAQMLAVHNGGKLRQDIRGHRGLGHLVVTDENSLARSATGYIKLHCVSLHHQMIQDPGRGFSITGRAIDGTVEIIEAADERCLGVQYHPEMDYTGNEASRYVFDWLVDKAAEHAGIAFPETPYRAPMYVPESKPKAKAKAKAKNRQAGTQTLPKAWQPKEQPTLPQRASSAQRKFDSSVTVSWLCPHCAMRFDDQDDREMHVAMIHGMPVDRDEWEARNEPPEGHPDWDDVRELMGTSTDALTTT